MFEGRESDYLGQLMVLGRNGVIGKVKENGDVLVECSGDRKFWFNPELLKVVDTSQTPIEVGDNVVVTDSIRKLKSLQDDKHGGWDAGMRKTMGSAGTVVGTLSNGCARVFVSGRRWIFNVNALRHVSRSWSPGSNITPADESPSRACDADMYLGKTGVVKSEQRNIVEVTFPNGNTHDIVSIESDKDRVKRLEKGHGGWAPHMVSVLGTRGYVFKVDSDGDVHVKCINNFRFCFHPKLLKVVDTSKMAIKIGDFVWVIKSYSKVRKYDLSGRSDDEDI
ncbi:hypothetical protein NP493_911g00025 [Ridgeia piscesae]|uniref:Mind bomb SH3 repeat domain-containing protein n=1 Tax=Ridgeia piscesae TaxID=27915 RepID=A0AAD9KKS1_RIDPI|nr:hypothetical protein NP493_911g00025 [Ridgeia piscesae]